MTLEGSALGRCSVFSLCSCMSAVYLPVERQSASPVYGLSAVSSSEMLCLHSDHAFDSPLAIWTVLLLA